jgi:protein phosphatase
VAAVAAPVATASAEASGAPTVGTAPTGAPAAGPAAPGAPTGGAAAQTAFAGGDEELQAELIAQAQSDAADEGITPEESATPTQPLVAPPEAAPAGNLEPGTRVGEYEIVELREERDGQKIYRATAPADVCAQCGTRAADTDARFCEECGAELVPRDVLLLERPLDATAPAIGPARLVELPDEPLRNLLPPVTAFMTNDQQYLVMEAEVPGFQSLAELLASQGEAPDQPAALDEADALPIATQLAQLLQYLHQNGTALGDLSLAQLLIGPQRRLRLRDASDLRPLDEQSRAADLQALASTLEDLARTPRQTRKLAPEVVAGTQARPESLQDVLALGRMGSLPDAQSWVKALESLNAAKRAIRSLATRVGARTDIGVQRELDEDAFLTQELRIALAGAYVNAGIYVVADGMGGHAAGEVASILAVRAAATSIAEQLVELASGGNQGVDDERLKTLVTTAVEQANLAVVQEAQLRKNDMGTTITLALVVGDRCIVGNVGDSRTYLFHGGQLQRISKDHSLVMRLVDVGQITEDEIYTHPHRNAILRSLGEKPNVETDLFPLRLEPGDSLFLCSDGQWEMVHNPRMGEVIATVDDPQAVCDQLVKEANANGGEDNITAVLVRFSAPSE